MSRSLLVATLLAMTAPGCASGGEDPAAGAPGGEYTLQPGERVGLADDTALRYVGVVSDSRCPPGAKCIRAGEAEVRFELTPQGAPPTTVDVITPDAPTASGAGWRLELISLEFGDAPAARVRLDR